MSQNDAELREALAAAQRLSDLAPTACHKLNEDGVIAAVNRKWCEIMGFSSEEVIGRSIFEFIIPEERKAAEASFAQKKRNPNKFQKGHERKFRTKDGAIRIFATNDYYFTESNVKMMHTSLEDITSLKKIEQNLLNANMQLSKALQDLRDTNMQLSKALEEIKRMQTQMIQHERLLALGQMTSGVAHDLNNTLMPILGYSEFAVSNGELLGDASEMRKIFREIAEAATHARDVVRGMREFAKPAEDDNFADVNIEAVIKSAVSLTEPRWRQQTQSEGKHVSVEVKADSSIVVQGSRAQLEEIFVNMIFNAVDAISGTGRIHIRAEGKRGKVLITVSDNGSGMTEDTRKRCFEPFFSTKGLESSGLGLAMVHGIIRRHGGTITVNSSAGAGSSFLINLPLSAAHDKPVRQTAVPKPAKPLNILIIEDEFISRNLVKRFLESEHHTVVPAACGKDGLDLLAKTGFDLVITDKAMPDMSGDQVALEARKLKPQTPVMLLTGFGELLKEQNIKPDGIDIVVSKPVTRDELIEAVSLAVAGRS